MKLDKNRKEKRKTIRNLHKHKKAKQAPQVRTASFICNGKNINKVLANLIKVLKNGSPS